MSANHLIVELDHQPIELCKLLKVANLVGGGGEAKIVISEGYVFLNGEVEFQKRKKIYHEDIIDFNGDLIQVMVDESLADISSNDIDLTSQSQVMPQSEPSNKKSKEKSAKGKRKNSSEKPTDQLAQEPVVNTPKKRRPISF